MHLHYLKMMEQKGSKAGKCKTWKNDGSGHITGLQMMTLFK